MKLIYEIKQRMGTKMYKLRKEALRKTSALFMGGKKKTTMSGVLKKQIKKLAEKIIVEVK